MLYLHQAKHQNNAYDLYSMGKEIFLIIYETFSKLKPNKLNTLSLVILSNKERLIMGLG